jgi:hypothetical protein
VVSGHAAADAVVNFLQSGAGNQGVSR